MQRLQMQLLCGLGRHELHRRALHGFGNRFGIIEGVLLSLATFRRKIEVSWLVVKDMA
jgi:hypothetical protein